MTKVKVLATGFLKSLGITPLNHYPVFINDLTYLIMWRSPTLYSESIPNVCIRALISSKGWVTAVDMTPLMTPDVNLLNP